METWAEWIQRVTHQVEAACRTLGVKDWVEEQRRRKWKWAGHVARRSDGRWTKEVLNWSPEGWRKRGRPVIRWSDFLDDFVSSQMGLSEKGMWEVLAQDREGWRLWTEDFATGT